ncbi:MAG: methionine gamma-lyase family protein [Oscillospiraceae bacterium]|nr:methionine gamma-lyase family protein [Oscillospiraceae bacterium]
MEKMAFSPEITEYAKRASEIAAPAFSRIDGIAEKNTAKVMAAFRKNRVDAGCFAGTTGYGYDDKGREVLDAVYADIFGAEAGLVRLGFVNGTHAITAALFSAVKPGDILLSATGLPYDTLQSAIGISGDYPGSLRYYGVEYRQVDLTEYGKPDYDAIRAAAADPRVKEVAVQRSRGYSARKAFTVAEIEKICAAVHEVNPTAAVVVDNCYGEFAEDREPTEVGADLVAGSLIKNPGGGIAPTGGYIVGKRELVDSAAMRLTCPGIGGECGSTLGNNRLLFQGLFIAPHTVAQALKTAVFCAAMMDIMGYKSSPPPLAPRSDIIQTVEFGNPDDLCLFCRGIQSGAPVDSYVTPEPWDMPGYEDKVIMAAGSFIQGSSIELSADGPMRPPYRAYIQGGLTFESGKLGIMLAAELLRKKIK